MGFILMLIVGGLIGWAAGAILGKDIPGGIIGNIIAGLIGSALGSAILGDWGPSIGGVYILPALIGSIWLRKLLIAIAKSTLLWSNQKGV